MCVPGVWKEPNNPMDLCMIPIMKRFNVSTAIVTIHKSKYRTGVHLSAWIVMKYLGGYKMEGFIKIESATQNGRAGLRVEGRMSKVNLVDKFHVLHCVCASLCTLTRQISRFSPS